MTRLVVIGIGAGGPDLVTMQAAAAIAEVDVFVIFDKGDATSDLAAARSAILDRYATAGAYRIVELDDPRRDRAVAYTDGVRAWHEQRVERLERFLASDIADGETAGVLVWGDPSLYDSTLRLIDQIVARGVVALDHEVIPAVSSVHLLAARHRIPLHRVGGSVHITTGRNLLAGGVAALDDVVVMLDSSQSFTALVDEPFEIFWGAYLGTPDEILVAGRLADVADEIVATRASARARKGWMFDIYLLRRVIHG